MESARFDILGLGCLAVDDLLYVERYPPPDSKTPVLRRQRQGGGLTGTALVAAARWGVSCRYAGCLGKDELSQFTRNRLREEGIGLEHVCYDEKIRPVHSMIVVDEGSHSRTIFFDMDGAARAADDWPPAQVIRGPRAVRRFLRSSGHDPRGPNRAGGGDSDRRRFRAFSRPSRLCRTGGPGRSSDLAAGFRPPFDRLHAARRCLAGALVAAAAGGGGHLRRRGLLVSWRRQSPRASASTGVPGDGR